ncbi:phosphatidate cytidylyltransferase [Ferruginibacter yonginensis]|uniref:Phosphatidate cytidylyltransferase n=1 Tax=Ferruginibacter yonginensis TaxID=1310416 RepID=A0ABV8QT08_9BACT
MQRSNYFIATFLLLIIMTTSSCAAIGGIFKAGVWTGIIAIVLVVALILFLVGKSKN